MVSSPLLLFALREQQVFVLIDRSVGLFERLSFEL